MGISFEFVDGGRVQRPMESEYMAWSREVFGHAVLGDERRTHRLVRMAGRAAERPSGRVSEVFCSRNEREGAYDFLENHDIRADSLAQSITEATGRAMAEHDLVFVPIDSTSLKLWDGTGHKDFGRIGTHKNKATGLKVTTALALDSDGVSLGLCGQSWWRRPRRRVRRRPRDRRSTVQKETRHWLEVISGVMQMLDEQAPETRCWFQLDRGGDAWPVLFQLVKTNSWFTVRSSFDRRLKVAGKQRYLRETLRKQPVLCTHTVEVAARRGHKDHPDRDARVARMSIRQAKVSLDLRNKANGRLFGATVNAVLVSERGTTPPGEDPIEWLLLTNHPTDTEHDAKLVVFGYGLRWRIEEFHKTWKTGCCDVERTQLHSSAAVMRWATILAAVATRVERIKHLARTTPNASATVEFSEAELRALVLLKRKYKSPNERIPKNPSIAQATLWIAELGGYTGKSSGGPPGSITLARGLERLLPAAEMIALLEQEQK